jgi:hypothetical protein
LQPQSPQKPLAYHSAYRSDSSSVIRTQKRDQSTVVRPLLACASSRKCSSILISFTITLTSEHYHYKNVVTPIKQAQAIDAVYRYLSGDRANDRE